MDLPAFETQIAALTQIVTGLANGGQVEDYLFGTFQGSLLSDIDQAGHAGLPRKDILELTRFLVQRLVELAERDDLTVSIELEQLIGEYAASGAPIRRVLTLSPAKLLETFPKEQAVAHTVFVDEAGTASFEEEAQPVLSLIGVLAHDSHIDEFTWATSALLRRYGLGEDVEVHAQEVLSGQLAFSGLSLDARETLLMDFLTLGLQSAVGVHYLSMLKPLVEPRFRAELRARGLDAYTSNVLYFNLTLRVAVIAKIGLAKYRYFFDRTDRYGKDIRRILEALRTESNPGLRVDSIAAAPMAVDSRDHRFVQLADVIGYYLSRYRQFEIKTFAPRDSLRKHQDKYEAAYQLIQPKVMSYVTDGLHRLIDWQAIQHWTHPKHRGAPKVGFRPISAIPKVGRNMPCPCGSGKKFKKCHGS